MHHSNFEVIYKVKASKFILILGFDGVLIESIQLSYECIEDKCNNSFHFLIFRNWTQFIRPLFRTGRGRKIGCVCLCTCLHSKEEIVGLEVTGFLLQQSWLSESQRYANQWCANLNPDLDSIPDSRLFSGIMKQVRIQVDSDSSGFWFEVSGFGFEMSGFAHHWCQCTKFHSYMHREKYPPPLYHNKGRSPHPSV